MACALKQVVPARIHATVSDENKHFFFAPCFFVKKIYFLKLICLFKKIYYKVYLIM